MKPTIKLALYTGLTALFVVFFCFVWLEQLPIQVIGLCTVLILFTLSFSITKVLHEFIILLPFILMLAAIYGILAVFQIGYPRQYWIHFGITRSALLISSMLFMQVVIKRIDINDMLSLPLHIGKLKYLILGKLLYLSASGSYDKITGYIELIPSQQVAPSGFITKLKLRLVTLLAMLGYIINLSSIKGEVIDDRIRHCHNREKL